uniref:Calponin-homology (CH) domain-containing protein n=1 Tax=Picocystis salinarum TaxID=88271 RepID=A0A7S3XC02_9CHLO
MASMSSALASSPLAAKTLLFDYEGKEENLYREDKFSNAKGRGIFAGLEAKPTRTPFADRSNRQQNLPRESFEYNTPEVEKGRKCSRETSTAKKRTPRRRKSIVDVGTTILQLRDGAPAPMLDFGRVNVGSTKVVQLVVETQEEQELHEELQLHGFAGAKGFQLPDGKLYFLQPGTKSTIRVSWKAQVAGFVRCVLRLVWNQSKVLNVQMRGLATVDAMVPKLGKRTDRYPLDGDRIHSAKKSKTVHISHAFPADAPFSTTAKKGTCRRSRLSIRNKASVPACGFQVELGGSCTSQERAFASWVNHVLFSFTSGEDSDCEVSTLHPNIHFERALLSSRDHLWSTFKGDKNLSKAYQKLKKKIAEGTISIDPGNSLLNDVRIQDRALRVMLGFHPFWLKLGLEVVAGASIPGGLSSKDDLKSMLKENLIAAPEIQQEYFIDPNVPSVFKKGYKGAVRGAVLCKCVLLVALLDRGIQSAPAGAPLLFRKNASIKESAGVLQALLKGSIKGGGDVLRPLTMLGFRFTYKQPVNLEYNFTVSNLAIDLRDGVKLLRLIEVLTSKDGLIKKSRLPAKNRGAMLFNVELALSAMSEVSLWATEGLGGRPLQASDIVCGDRERSLWLLWQMIVHWQVSAVVNAGILRNEINDVRAQQASYRLDILADETIKLCSSADAVPEYCLLAKWVQEICSQYFVQIHNLSTDFADGVALCLVLHHYLGEEVLPLQDISLPEIIGHSQGKETCQVQHAHVVNDRACRNFCLFRKTMQYFGGSLYASIPSGVGPCTVDEKSTIAFLCFLFQRLVSSSDEVKAAVYIQRRYRQRKNATTPSLHLQKWIASATIIQKAFRRHLEHRRHTKCDFQKQRRAALKIQSWVRGWLFRTHLMRSIQEQTLHTASWFDFVHHGMHSGGDDFCPVPSTLAHAMQLQLQYRQFLHLNRCATVIQANVRRFLVECRAHRVQTRNAEELARVEAATRLQAAVRGYFSRRQFVRTKEAAITLQAFARGCQARRILRNQEQAVALMQRYVHGKILRSSFLQKRAAAIRVQAAFRGCMVRSSFRLLRSTACTIQAHWRRHHARQIFKKMQQAAIKIQSFWRGHLARLEYAELLQMKQAMVEMMKAAEEYSRKYRAAVTIQASIRAFLGRKRLALLRAEMAKQQAWKEGQSAVAIQACWRGYVIRSACTERMHQIRARLDQATSKLRLDPSLSIHAKARVALSMLLNSDCLVEATKDCASLDKATMYFPDCCRWMVDSGGLDKLFQLIRACNRSKPHKRVLSSSLHIVYNMCHLPDIQQEVFDVEDSVNILIEVLQIYRDMEHVFGLATQVLHIMCTCEARVVDIRAMPEVCHRLEMIAHILSRKVQMEEKFLGRLSPAQRSSLPAFASAEKRLVALQSMLDSLLEVLEVLGGQQSAVLRTSRVQHSAMLRTLATPASVATAASRPLH